MLAGFSQAASLERQNRRIHMLPGLSQRVFLERQSRWIHMLPGLSQVASLEHLNRWIHMLPGLSQFGKKRSRDRRQQSARGHANYANVRCSPNVWSLGNNQN